LKELCPPVVLPQLLSHSKEELELVFLHSLSLRWDTIDFYKYVCHGIRYLCLVSANLFLTTERVYLYKYFFRISAAIAGSY
jgi:hypothetical protein